MTNPPIQTVQPVKTCNQAAGLAFPEPFRFGPAFVESETGSLSIPGTIHLHDLHDDFWSLTLPHTVYQESTGQFRQYHEHSGLYEPVSENTLIGQLVNHLDQAAGYFPDRVDHKSFVLLKSRSRLKSVVERARDVLAVSDQYFEHGQQLLHLANGCYNFNNNTLEPFCPAHHAIAKLNVVYDPNARCDLFLEAFLGEILGPDDIDLLQRYLSMLLQGRNHAQKILVLTGDAGWGKSSLMQILCHLIGYDTVGIIRDQLYKDNTELSHYRGKHLLYHPDMPTQFLNHGQSAIFKQLVGGDLLWADLPNGERTIMEGQFPVVLACNGKPQIAIDHDVEAWARRLVVLKFARPAHDTHLGKMGELLRSEASGILNWLLAGRRKLSVDKLQLTMTSEQQARTAMLLLSSESPVAFVRSRLTKSKNSLLAMADLYEAYQQWCRNHQLPPFGGNEFKQLAKTSIELQHGLRYRHDLPSEGGCVRGWKGLALVDSDDAQQTSAASN